MPPAFALDISGCDVVRCRTNEMSVMNLFKKFACLFGISGLCLLFVGCGSVLRNGCCDAQGNLAYGAEPLHVRNLDEVQRLVHNNPFDQLGVLRDYLGVNAMGKSRTEGASAHNIRRYDAWTLCTVNRYSMAQNDYYLLVESEYGKVLRLAYAAVLDDGVWTTGDPGLVQALRDGLNKNCRSLPCKAVAGAAARAHKMSRAYRQYVNSGGNTQRFYRPTAPRKVNMPPAPQKQAAPAPAKKPAKTAPKRAAKPQPKPAPKPEAKPDYRSEVLKHLN